MLCEIGESYHAAYVKHNKRPKACLSTHYTIPRTEFVLCRLASVILLLCYSYDCWKNFQLFYFYTRIRVVVFALSYTEINYLN